MPGTPKSTRHIRVTRPRKSGSRQVNISYGDSSAPWFVFKPIGGVALITTQGYPVYEWTVSMADLESIIYGAEEAIVVLDKAIQIAGDRAVEILGTPIKRSVILSRPYWYSGWYNTEILAQLIREFGSAAYVNVEFELDNRLRVYGEELTHSRKIFLYLRGVRLNDAEQELLNQLRRDLAEIFGAARLADPSTLTPIWAEEDTYKLEARPP